MTTARDIIQDSLEMLKVYSPGETATFADYARGFSALNNMLDEWSNENLYCYAISEQTCLFIPGEFQYTIGPGGYVNGARPIRLISIPGSAYVLDLNGNQYGMDVITQDQWNQRGSRNTNSNFPDVLFYDPQFPLGLLNFDPVPNVGYTAYFDSYLQIAEFGTLEGVLELPPGYEGMMKSNLAVYLKPYFKQAQLDPIIARRAEKSVAAIKRSNIRNSTANYDPEILSRGNGTYNIYTDSYSRNR